MSGTSFIEKLLDGVEVEWKPLFDVFNLKNGYTPSKSKKEYWENGTIPWFRMDDIRQNGYILNDSLQKVTEVAVKGGKLFPANSIIVATSATIGEHALITVPYIANQRFTCLSIKENYLAHFKVKFLFYYCFLLSDWCTKNTTKSSFASVEMDGFKKFPIPIICPSNPKKSLEIQTEIVRILDAFTAMTAELTAELSLRKKQYNYYRDKLLSFEEGEVDWMKLGELVKDKFWIMPATPKFDENEDIPYITSKNISSGHINFNKVKYISRQDFSDLSRNRPILSGDFLISMIGTIGEIAKVKESDGDFYGQNMYLIRLDEHMIHAGYFLHFFDSPKMKRHFSLVKNNSGQGYLKANNIEDILVPIPSLDEQVRIASLLDKFDALTNSITEGLPREIELRQKQYEYYRDLLLSFPKPDTKEVA